MPEAKSPSDSRWDGIFPFLALLEPPVPPVAPGVDSHPSPLPRLGYLIKGTPWEKCYGIRRTSRGPQATLPSPFPTTFHGSSVTPKALGSGCFAVPPHPRCAP